MKNLLTFILFSLSLTVQAKLQIIPSDDSQDLKGLIDEVRPYLPKGVTDIEEKVIVRFSKLDNYPEMQNPCVRKKRLQVYGKLEKNIITLNENFRPHLLESMDGMDQFSCGHKNYKKLAIATLIHEIIHVFDDKMKSSSTLHYQNLAGTGYNFFGQPALKNKNTLRSIDPYEYKNFEEHFATNSEFFLLDDEYACRRPNLAAFFQETYQATRPTCRNFAPVLVQLENGIKSVKLTPENVEDIRFVLADKGPSAASRFGHAMFRLVLKDGTEDISVGFVGVTDTMSISNIKGLTGKYPSKLQIGRYATAIKNYTHNEFRSVQEYSIKFDNTQKEKFLAQVLTLFYEYSGRYYFITNNCATEALGLIKVADPRPEILNENPLTPKGILEVLIKADLVNVEDRIIINSYWDTITKFYSNAIEIVGEIKLENYFKSNALKRRKVLKHNDSINKSSLIAAFALERTVQKKNADAFEKAAMKKILGLGETHPMYELSRKVHIQSIELSSATLFRTGYGQPLEHEFQDKHFTLLENQNARIAEALAAIAKWTMENVKNLKELNEIVETEKNVEYLKEMIRNSKQLN